jgi:hypothetical protein
MREIGKDSGDPTDEHGTVLIRSSGIITGDTVIISVSGLPPPTIKPTTLTGNRIQGK